MTSLRELDARGISLSTLEMQRGWLSSHRPTRDPQVDCCPRCAGDDELPDGRACPECTETP